MKRPSPPVLLLRKIVQRLGLHPDDHEQLEVTNTPQHPETELMKKGALYESRKRISDVLANHWVIDGNLVTGQNQNAGPIAREMLRLAQERLVRRALT